MNKKNIVQKLPAIVGSSSQAEDIIKAIAEAMEEWENARAYFQMASEPKLVDYAIYLEAAARSRYSYLIGEAREKGITVDSGNMLKKIIGI